MVNVTIKKKKKEKVGNRATPAGRDKAIFLNKMKSSSFEESRKISRLIRSISEISLKLLLSHTGGDWTKFV